MKIDFNRIRRLRSEYRKRTNIYRIKTNDLQLNKNNLKKQIQEFLHKIFIQTSRSQQHYLNDFDFDRIHQINQLYNQIQFRRIFRRHEIDQFEY